MLLLRCDPRAASREMYPATGVPLASFCVGEGKGTYVRPCPTFPSCPEYQEMRPLVCVGISPAPPDPGASLIVVLSGRGAGPIGFIKLTCVP